MSLSVAKSVKGGKRQKGVSALVLVSGTQGLLLEVDSRGVHGVVRSELAKERIAGVCSAANPAEFAVLTESGALTVYRLPR